MNTRAAVLRRQLIEPRLIQLQKSPAFIEVMAFAGSQDIGEFYVTRESQKDKKAKDRKLSYVGMRDITQIDKIEEEDIVEANGELRGIKNRVRAGLANFEDVGALKRVKSLVYAMFFFYKKIYSARWKKARS